MTPRRAAARWIGGWWTGAQRRASPHHDERPPGTPVTLAILHSISLPPGQFGTPDVERLFAGTLACGEGTGYEALRGLRVSAHFFVRRGGQVLQFVDCDRRAWHAGVSRWRGRERCNDDSVGIEFEGLEGGVFSAAQYRAGANVLRALRMRYAIGEVVGHEHVAPGRKHDPGHRFDWHRLRRATACRSLAVWPRIQGTT